MSDPKRQVLVRSMTWESDRVLSLQLVDPSGATLPAWRAGAHVALDVGGLERQYSLCGDPVDLNSYRVAVLRETDSRGGSAFVHARLRPGDLLRMGDPRNTFPLVDSPRYVFVAGGIGITPLLAMIATVEAERRPWRLLYGGRSRDSMAFLRQLETYGGDRVAIRPEDECGLLDLVGEVPAVSDTVVYCCGPERLIRALEEHCVSWPPGSLKVERFAPKELSDAEIADRAAREGEFEVVLAHSGVQFLVPVGRSIVEVLEENGTFPSVSCLEGTCGTCESKVLQGIPDHRDSILDDDERAANETMMICVSRCLSERLVLDL